MESVAGLSALGQFTQESGHAGPCALARPEPTAGRESTPCQIAQRNGCATPSSCAATTWEPSAFETRAEPISMCRKRPVCDTRARAPAGAHHRVSYPVSDSMSCRRRARGPVPCAERALRHGSPRGERSERTARAMARDRPEAFRRRPCLRRIVRIFSSGSRRVPCWYWKPRARTPIKTEPSAGSSRNGSPPSTPMAASVAGSTTCPRTPGTSRPSLRDIRAWPPLTLLNRLGNRESRAYWRFPRPRTDRTWGDSSDKE